MRSVQRYIIGVLIAGVLIFVELSERFAIRHENPNAADSFKVPPGLPHTLLEACFDCHSNATRWPWYSRIAPFSWMIAYDVSLGRKELNFSEWCSYSNVEKRRKLLWIGRVVREGTMPPWRYCLLHPAARLTAAQRALILRWVQCQLDKMGNARQGRPEVLEGREQDCAEGCVGGLSR